MNKFPVEALPVRIQEIIDQTYKCLSFPKDFTATAMLHAASVAIGNTYAIQPHGEGWVEAAVLYCILVGPTGMKKTPPMSFAYKPLLNADDQNYEEYKKAYEQYVNKKMQGLKPVGKKIVVTDYTPEALNEVHSHNLKGIALFIDEIAGWFENFNRYSNGNEEGYWLSNWSGQAIEKIRVGSQNLRITKPFIGIIGSIQNKILKKLMGGRRTESGMMQRMLYAVPYKNEVHNLSRNELPLSVNEDWEEIINKLMELEVKINTGQKVVHRKVGFTRDAHQFFEEWYNKNMALIRKEDDDGKTGIYTKLTSNFIRISLVLYLLEWACRTRSDKTDITDIDKSTVEKAAAIIEYYRKTSLRVYDDLNDPKDRLNELQREVYANLPEFFSTGNGIQIAEDIGMKSRTFERFIKRKLYFKCLSKGNFRKIA